MDIKKFPPTIQRLITAVTGQDGATSTTLRSQAMDRAVGLGVGEPTVPDIPTEWETYIDTVIKHAYRVTDTQTDRLLANGHSEDEIFELTIASALGAGVARLERGLSAVEAASGKRS